MERDVAELVFMRDGNVARLRIVKTGKPIAGEIEIVSGVSAGEQIVTERAGELIDGQPINPRP